MTNLGKIRRPFLVVALVMGVVLVSAYFGVLFLPIRTAKMASVLPVYLAEPAILTRAERDSVVKALGFENALEVRTEETIAYELANAKVMFRLSGRGGFLYERTQKKIDVSEVRDRLDALSIAFEFLRERELLPYDSHCGEGGSSQYTNDVLQWCEARFNPGEIPVKTRARMITVRVAPTGDILRVNWRWAKLKPVAPGNPRIVEEAIALTPFEPKSVRDIDIEYGWRWQDNKRYLVPKYVINTEFEGDVVSVYPRFGGREMAEDLIYCD